MHDEFRPQPRLNLTALQALCLDLTHIMNPKTLLRRPSGSRCDCGPDHASTHRRASVALRGAFRWTDGAAGERRDATDHVACHQASPDRKSTRAVVHRHFGPSLVYDAAGRLQRAAAIAMLVTSYLIP